MGLDRQVRLQEAQEALVQSRQHAETQRQQHDDKINIDLEFIGFASVLDTAFRGLLRAKEIMHSGLEKLPPFFK